MNKDNLEQHNLPMGTFGYSASGFDELGATEYTLVTIVVDTSGSVCSYKTEMENSIKEVVSACKHSPRADNLMIRIVTFNSQISELQGFKLLADCNEKDYNNCLSPCGTTALYDAANNAISATNDYAKKLGDSDFGANAIIVIITDGCDNDSNEATMNDVKKSLQTALREESLESLLTILVGVGIGDYPDVGTILNDFKDNAGLTQYVEIKDANAKTLAKLAEFVSKSISSQSQALGTGGASQALTF
jgi:uncharacterized protein YegL